MEMHELEVYKDQDSKKACGCGCKSTAWMTLTFLVQHPSYVDVRQKVVELTRHDLASTVARRTAPKT